MYIIINIYIHIYKYIHIYIYIRIASAIGSTPCPPYHAMVPQQRHLQAPPSRTHGMVHHGGKYEAHQTTGGAGSNTTIPVRGGDSCDTAKDCHPWGIGEALPAHQICYPLLIKLLPIGLPMWPELLVRRDLCRKRPHYRRKALDSLENCYAERKTAKARPAMS